MVGEHHIYMTRDGRFSMAALKPGDVAYVASAMREVLVGGRGVKTPRLPLDLGGRQFSVRSQPPRLGEHARASLLGAGLSSSAVEELVATGLVVAEENQST